MGRRLLFFVLSGIQSFHFLNHEYVNFIEIKIKFKNNELQMAIWILNWILEQKNDIRGKAGEI